MIKINCYKVNETGKKYKEDAEYFRETKTQMNSLYDGFKAAWNNTENVNFLASFRDHINDIDKFADFMDNSGNILVEMSGRHNEAESNFKKNVEIVEELKIEERF